MTSIICMYNYIICHLNKLLPNICTYLVILKFFLRVLAIRIKCKFHIFFRKIFNIYGFLNFSKKNLFWQFFISAIKKTFSQLVISSSCKPLYFWLC